MIDKVSTKDAGPDGPCALYSAELQVIPQYNNHIKSTIHVDINK